MVKSHLNRPFVQKSHMLVSKLRSGTSQAKAGPGALVRVALFWNLLTSMYDVVPCDRIVQRAYYQLGLIR